MSLYRWLARTDGQVTGESWPTQADPPIVSGLSPPPPPMDLHPPHPLFREHHLMYGLGEQGFIVQLTHSGGVKECNTDKSIRK